MKSTEGIDHRDVKRVCLLIGIIASLCFSAGEGLRLRPFPADAITQINLPEGQLNTSDSCETSPAKYDPIDVPRQTQASSKNKRSDIDCLPAMVVVNGSPRFRDMLTFGEAPNIASLQLISRARDRAPPSSPTS